MRLKVKHMVSYRCIMVVRQNLDDLGILFINVELGEIETRKEVTIRQREDLRVVLLTSGLSLIEDPKSVLIEQIKVAVIELVHHSEDEPKVNFSTFLSQKLGYNYTYLANIFSQYEGLTIEQFTIINRIERAKELLSYDELNLTEISYKLHYSSVSHLSYQFKKITGETPTDFKNHKRGATGRTPLESL